MRYRKPRQQQNLENNLYLSTHRAFPTLYWGNSSTGESIGLLNQVSRFKS